MKGPLSLLSAAVLFVLTGPNADASRQATRMSQQESTPASPATRYRSSPAGSGILYNQTAGQTNVGLPVNSSVASSSYSSLGADDFVVPTDEAWTINGFVIPYSSAHSSVPSSADIKVYSDDGTGHPGATLLCNAVDTPGIATSTYFTFTLAVPCVLQDGSYWFTLQFKNVDFFTNWVYWKVNGPIANQPAQWENPGGGFELGCSSWDDIATCFMSVASSLIGGDFAFQITGTSRSVPDEIFFDGFDGP